MSITVINKQQIETIDLIERHLVTYLLNTTKEDTFNSTVITVIVEQESTILPDSNCEYIGDNNHIVRHLPSNIIQALQPFFKNTLSIKGEIKK